MPSAWAVIPAAGSGRRLGSSDGIPKAMRPLAGTAMFIHAVRACDRAASIEAVVVVVDELWLEHALSELVPEQLRVKLEMVTGGPTRQSSVGEGLKAVPSSVDAVVVHDAARPLVRPELIGTVVRAITEGVDAAVCAVPVADTLKRVEQRMVTATVQRDGLWQAQTPQAFRTEALREAHVRAARERFEGTDDAALIERSGGTVAVVEGDPRNIKITTRADLAVAEALLGAER